MKHLTKELFDIEDDYDDFPHMLDIDDSEEIDSLMESLINDFMNNTEIELTEDLLKRIHKKKFMDKFRSFRHKYKRKNPKMRRF